MEELPRLSEHYGRRSSHSTSYHCDHVSVRRLRRSGGRPRVWTAANKFIKEVFLPQGYPDTVSSDYISYQLWDTLQAFCSSITAMLATLAVLKGVGVGDSTATPLAATITWMFKDGAGMISRILFGWIQGVDLDCNAKRWRLVADFLNDLAKFLELLTPLFPPHLFLPIVCAASVCSAIVGSAGMATRAALVQHQARRDNMADVAAKDNSQETVVNLAGLLVNLFVTPAVAGKTHLVWTLFTVFTILHLLANHRAVSVVCMETFNKNRLHITMHDYLISGRVSPPSSVNDREPIVQRSSRILSYKLGVLVSSVITSPSEYRAAVLQSNKAQNYVLKFQRSHNQVLVALSSNSSSTDQLSAAITTEILDYICRGQPLTTPSPLASFAENIHHFKAAGDNGVSLARYVDEELTPTFLPLLLPLMMQAGWVTSHHLLGANEWRYSFETQSQ